MAWFASIKSFGGCRRRPAWLAWTGLGRLGSLAGRRQRIPFHVTLRSAALLWRGRACGRDDEAVAWGRADEAVARD